MGKATRQGVDHGYPVDLVERGGALGGNLHWRSRTIEGDETAPLLESMVHRVEKHPHIHLHLESEIAAAFGEVGGFTTTVLEADGTLQALEHGAVILATGGREARSTTTGRISSLLRPPAVKRAFFVPASISSTRVLGAGPPPTRNEA